MAIAVDNENAIHAEESVLALVPCTRFQKGRLVEEKILVKLDRIEGSTILMILSEWSHKNRCWSMIRSYLVRETETDFPGRAFRLFRGLDAIENEQDEESYEVFVSNDPEQPDICCCRGSHVTPVCKHCGSLRYLVTNNHI